MDEKFARLIRAAKAVREAYPHGDIAPNQMPSGEVANKLMDELEAATTNAIDSEDDVGKPAFLDRDAKLAKWMRLRDEAGRIFHKYVVCPVGGKMEFKTEEIKFSFNIYQLEDLFKAFLAIDDDLIVAEFEPEFWYGHDSAMYALISIFTRALDEQKTGNFGSPQLTALVKRIADMSGRIKGLEK